MLLPLQYLWECCFQGFLKNLQLKSFIFIFLSLSLEVNAFNWNKNYLESRKEFLVKSNSLIQLYKGSRLESVPLNISNENLTIDYLYIPSKEKTDKLWLISAGVHGIESYVGSVLVNWLLDEKVKEMVNSNTGVLVFHSLNPYGFFHKRRFNENNVDLNRNFILNFENFKDPNNSYSKFNKYLNPELPATYSKIDKYSTWAYGVYLIALHGMQALRKSIVSGQYSFSKGIFFGGNKKEESVGVFEKITKKIVQNYKTVFHLDFHTGYGERGRLHFYGFNNYPVHIKASMEVLFKDLPIDKGGDGDFYQVSGDITNYLPKLFPKKRIIPMTLEYGTLNSQTTVGSLESLYRIRSENQLYHFGAKDKKSSSLVEHDFMEMFNPSSLKWRSDIEKVTVDTFEKFIYRFNSLK